MQTIATEIETIVEVSELTLTGVATEADVETQLDPLDEAYYRHGEILFTFVDTTSRPAPDSPRVETLLRRIRDIAGIELEPIANANDGRSGTQAPHLAGAPLTLRFRAIKQGSGESSRDHVRDAVDAVNAALHELEHEGILVSSACPNWLTTTGWGHVIGGPATLPDPAPPGSWPITVPPGVRWPAGQAGPRQKVIVAVLDSSPGKAALEQAAQMARNQANALMQDLAHNNVIVDWNRFDAPDGVETARQPVESDHGLFVAGVIHRIAPHAEIHLLHVLDDTGTGHTHLMLDALDYCLALVHSGHRVIVNMSMYMSIPPGEHLWDYWFGGQPAMPQIHPSRQAELIDALDEAVEQRIDLLLDAGAVVVAAAGNDALRRRRRAAADGAHPQPRLPADFDGVICVVATNREGRIAAYSNRADIPATGNCVATYGGEGMLDGKATVVPPGTPPDGMVSVYTRLEVPAVDGMRPNMTGWVYWSGTSFATPVVSGMAANVVAANEIARQTNPTVARLTSRQVLTKILDTANPPAETDPALGCPYVPVTLTQ